MPITIGLILLWIGVMGGWLLSIDRAVTWQLPDEGEGGIFVLTGNDGQARLRGRIGVNARSVSLLQGTLIYLVSNNHCEKFPSSGFLLHEKHRISIEKLPHKNIQEACGLILPMVIWDHRGQSGTTTTSFTFLKIPLWAFFFPLTFWICIRIVRKMRTVGIEFGCMKCGYDLRGLKSGRCPECGETISAWQMDRIGRASDR